MNMVGSLGPLPPNVKSRSYRATSFLLETLDPNTAKAIRT
jgi:hypothetical protein